MRLLWVLISDKKFTHTNSGGGEIRRERRDWERECRERERTAWLNRTDKSLNPVVKPRQVAGRERERRERESTARLYNSISTELFEQQNPKK